MRQWLVMGAMLLMVFTAGRWAVAAPGQPGATAVGGTATSMTCDGVVGGRKQDHALTGTPVPPPSEPPAGIGDGAQAAPEVVMEIQATLAALERCQELGDVQGALTLFSDDAGRRLMASAPDGSPPGGAGQATPGRSGGLLPIIPPVRDEDLRLLPDGRVGAVLTSDATPATGVTYVVLRQSGGRWMIDEVGERLATAAPGSSDDSTAIVTPEKPIDPAAEPVVAAARAAAAETLGVGVNQVQVDAVEPRDWPDAAIGCPQPETMYAEVITPGFVVRVTAGGQAIEVHTDATGERTAIC